MNKGTIQDRRCMDKGVFVPRRRGFMFGFLYVMTICDVGILLMMTTYCMMQTY